MYGKKRKNLVCTVKRMDMSLENVTARIGIGKIERTAIIKATNKRSAGRNKKTTKINKRKRIMSLKRYIMMGYFLTMTHLCERMKQQTRKLRNFVLLTQDLRHIWLTA